MFVKSAVVMNTGTVAAAQPAENSQNVAGTNPVDPKISEVAKNVIPNTKTEADNKAIPKKVAGNASLISWKKSSAAFAACSKIKIRRT
ncbi:MAG: hypothetical protein HWD61_11920 [Parachlamydiaceae bacterium]|nr:MAG: hypothetical protein HWD61_11920 [Parachlamydiaceae bacterium]